MRVKGRVQAVCVCWKSHGTGGSAGELCYGGKPAAPPVVGFNESEAFNVHQPRFCVPEERTVLLDARPLRADDVSRREWRGADR